MNRVKASLSVRGGGFPSSVGGEHAVEHSIQGAGLVIVDMNLDESRVLEDMLASARRAQEGTP